jgi:hypothetical protein
MAIPPDLVDDVTDDEQQEVEELLLHGPPATSVRVWVCVLTPQHLENVLGKTFSNLSVSGHRLSNLRERVLIPIMSPPVAYQQGTPFPRWHG